MKIKMLLIILISLLLLNIILISLDFQYETDIHINKKKIGLFNEINDFDIYNYDLGDIEIISEPIFSENYNTAQSYNPKIAIENEKIYIVWEDSTNLSGSGDDQDIFFRYFDGYYWHEIEVISEPIMGMNLNDDWSFSPDISVDNGNIYIVWEDASKYGNKSHRGPEVFFRCKPSGSDWEDIQILSGKTYSQKPNIAVEDGKIHVVWFNEMNIFNSGTDNDIFYTCNITGSSWEPIQLISEPILGENINNRGSEYPKIAVENDNIYVVWVDRTDYMGSSGDWDIFYRSNIVGSGWGDIQVISEPIINENLNDGDSEHPSIVVENGSIYVVWNDNTDCYGSEKDEDVFIRCYIKEKGWEDIQILSEPLEDLYDVSANFRNPEIDVQNGKIFIIWEDMANIDYGGTNGEILYRCNVTGFNWEDIQVVSEPQLGEDINTGFTYGPDIVVEHGTSHVVWWGYNDTHGSGKDADIFYRQITLTQVLGLEKLAPESGNTSTVFNFTASYFNLLNGMPQEVVVTIDNMSYNMFEIDSSDKNIIDGKQYFFNIENLAIGEHSYFFRAKYGGRYTYTELSSGPTVCNTPPHIITRNNLTALEDTYYDVSYCYNDIDTQTIGQQCHWIFSSDAEWLEFDNGSGILAGMPSNRDVGKYWVNITISDAIDIDFTNFTLTVLNENDPPEITNSDKINATVGELYSVNYHAVDIDPPPVTLSWSLRTNASGWLEMDNESGWLHGIPGNDDAGTFWVDVSVADGQGGTDHHNFTLRVIGPSVHYNTPPALSDQRLTPAGGDTDTSFIFSVHYYDGDSDMPDPIEVVIDGAGYYMTLVPGENATNGVYIFSMKLSEGSHVYYFTASDGDETVRTNETATPDIRKASARGEINSWFGLTWVIVIIVILILIVVTYVYIRHKISRIPTVKTELLPPQIEVKGLPAIQPGEAGTLTPIIPKTTLQPLPSQSGQPSQTIDITANEPAGTDLPTKAVTPQYQLPRETLSKGQKLGLLQERFLRGEVSEQTYKQLKDEIENTGKGEIDGINNES